MSREYPERPFVGVGVVIWRDERVLLVRRGRPPRQGRWSLPGGLQELGETVFQAAVREVLEETSLTVEPTALVDVVDLIEPDRDGRVRYHYTLVDVSAEWRAGEPVAGDDVAHAEWFTLDTLPADELWDETVRIVKLSAAQRHRRPGR
jgi:ADP-ribose pyrophosphatase YjhB (NUDIX family)